MHLINIVGMAEEIKVPTFSAYSTLTLSMYPNSE